MILCKFSEHIECHDQKAYKVYLEKAHQVSILDKRI